MRRIIDDFNRTQALANSINLREQFKINNPLMNSQLLETQRLCASIRYDVLPNNPILEAYQNNFNYDALTQAAQLSANFANVYEIFSCTSELKRQIEEVQKLASFATANLNQTNQFRECINRHFQNNCFASLQFESDRLRKIFESMIPKIALNIPSVPNFLNDNFSFQSDIITFYETDDIKITEKRTTKGKHFVLSCSENIGIKEQEVSTDLLTASLTDLKQNLQFLFLCNLSKKDFINILGNLLLFISIFISHQDAKRAHQDALQAHLDAERAHQDAIISQQNDQVQIEQGNRIIELLESNQTIDIKVLEEMRALREAQKLNIKNKNYNNEKRHE